MTRWGDQALRRAALAAFGLAVVLTVVHPVLHHGLAGSPVLTRGDSNDGYSEVLLWMLMATSALIVLWFRPRHGVGWVLMVSGLALALCTVGQLYGGRAAARPEEHLPLGTWSLMLSAPLWLVSAFLPVTSLLLRYPSGQVEGRWARRVERAVWIAIAAWVLGYAGGHHSVTDEVPGELPPIGLPPIVQGVLLGAGALVILPASLFSVAHTLRRTWRASYPERQQLVWLLTFTPLAVLALFLPVGGLQHLFLGVPLAVVIGVFRYRLLGIEVVVRRTLLYGSLTGLVLLVFVAVTAGLSRLLGSGGLSQLLAALLVAVGVVPLRDRLQGAVDRLVYGDRGDPLKALTRLATPLGISTPDALLPEVLAGVASSLRVPGAEVVGQGGARATVGLGAGEGVEVPLVMGGETIGVLRLAPRPGEKQLPSADRRLVESLAPLLAAVLQSVELASALSIEQERVVAATETERARLRQDLHDGLGPSLTGIGLGLEALESRVGASDLVDRLRAETASSLEEVRRIIDGLRPGALESADLLALLRTRAEHLSTTTPVRVRVVAPDRMPPLPEAVEATALRVVEEALTNVVRHAAATTCTVTVRLADVLTLEVKDDGKGYDGPRAGGVGVLSMQTRAEALGGRCDVVGSEGGTTVSLVLPAVEAVGAGVPS